MWCCTGDNYKKVEEDDNDDDDDDDDDEIDRQCERGVNNGFSPDLTEHQLKNGSSEFYHLSLNNKKHSTLDAMPRDILLKIAQHLDIPDLICLEHTNMALCDFVLQYWKTFCEKCGIKCDPTPLCVAWHVNNQSLYSYDNASRFFKNPLKKWRIAAMRSFLVDTFCCVICGQHLKDRMSVDGIYFNHDVLLCFPDCYRIFTININSHVLAICENYGIGQNELLLISSSYPVLLVYDFIKTLRQMDINEKKVLAEMRPYLGFSREILQGYFDFIEKIRTLASLL